MGPKGPPDTARACVSDVLRPGINCWAAERASRAIVLTNADYFAALATCLSQARRLIVLNGWLFDPHLVLDPASGGPAGLPLLRFLDRLLADRPSLYIRLLFWNRTLLYGGNGDLPRLAAEARRRNPRLDYRFVSPGFGASSHQKLVCIDDRIAFAGGIDLSSDRWDRRSHRVYDRRRKTAEGEPYGPIHDVQIMIEGRAAAAVAEVAKGHWTRCAGEVLAPCAGAESSPPALPRPADFADAKIAVARTDPRHGVREIAALHRDLLRAARRSIYIESQYLTAAAVGDILAERLGEGDPPEIVIVLPRLYPGALERLVMGSNRARLLRRLAAADRQRRLRVYYPVSREGHAERGVKIHAKFMIVDDCFLRVGSANLNNRSMAVDTECDLLIQAVDDAQRAKIHDIQARLIAEHIHVPAERVLAAHRETGSLHAVIDRLDGGHHLRSLMTAKLDGPTAPIPGTFILDPAAPLTLRYLADAAAGALDLSGLSRRLSSAASSSRMPTANGTRK